MRTCCPVAPDKARRKSKHNTGSVFPRPEPIDWEQVTRQQVLAMRDEYYGLGCRIGAIHEKYTRLGWQPKDIDNAVYFRTYRWLG